MSTPLPRPNHIHLPPQPSGQDVFSSSQPYNGAGGVNSHNYGSALDSAPTPSATSSVGNSPFGSPYGGGNGPDASSASAWNQQQSRASLGRRSTLGRNTANPVRSLRGSTSRTSFRVPSATSGWVGRRQSRASTIGQRLWMSPGQEVGEIAALRGSGDEPAAIPALVPGIRPAYSTPLPTLPMVVLCIVSPQLLLKKT